MNKHIKDMYYSWVFELMVNKPDYQYRGRMGRTQGEILTRKRGMVQIFIASRHKNPDFCLYP